MRLHDPYQDTMECAPVDEAVAQARRRLADGAILDEANGVAPFFCGCMVFLAADGLDDAMAVLDASMAHAHTSGSALGVIVVKTVAARAWLWRAR